MCEPIETGHERFVFLLFQTEEAGFTTAMKLADAPQIQRLPKVDRVSYV